MGRDSAASQLPRVSSPVSFERLGAYVRFLSLYVVVLFIFFVSALAANAEEIATPSFAERLLADECITNYNRNTDYFAGKKLNVAANTQFQVSYHKSYKIVTNLRSSQATYVIYLCGTPNPDTDAQLKATLPDLEDAIFLEFPPATYGVSSQTHFPLLDAMGVLPGLVLYPTFVDLPTCVLDASENGITQPASVESSCSFPTYESCAQALWEASDAEIFFADSFSIIEPVEDHTTVIVSQETASNVISETSWMLYLSVFFNREIEAQVEFFTLNSELDCYLKLVLDDEDALVLARQNLGLSVFAIDPNSTLPSTRRLSASEERQLVDYRRSLFETIKDPIVRANLLQTSTPFGTPSRREERNLRNRRLDDEATNVLILTGFDNFGEPGYYVARCSAYYCVHAETSGTNVNIIDAGDLEIDPAFFNHISQADLLTSLHAFGETIDVVFFLYYLHTDPNGISRDFAGPSDNGNDFLTELLTDMNGVGEPVPRLYYINDTNHWFGFRTGAPHFVQHDFIKILNPSLVTQTISLDDNSFYFFEEFEYEAAQNATQVVQNLLLDVNQETCPDLAKNSCEGAVLITPRPTAFVEETPAPSAPNAASMTKFWRVLTLSSILALLVASFM